MTITKVQISIPSRHFSAFQSALSAVCYEAAGANNSASTHAPLSRTGNEPGWLGACIYPSIHMQRALQWPASHAESAELQLNCRVHAHAQMPLKFALKAPTSTTLLKPK
jgi:hypothetical protein